MTIHDARMAEYDPAVVAEARRLLALGVTAGDWIDFEARVRPHGITTYTWSANGIANIHSAMAEIESPEEGAVAGWRVSGYGYDEVYPSRAAAEARVSEIADSHAAPYDGSSSGRVICDIDPVGATQDA